MRCNICHRVLTDGGEHVVVHDGSAPPGQSAGTIAIVDSEFAEGNTVYCAGCAAEACAFMAVLAREARAYRADFKRHGDDTPESADMADTTNEVQLHLVNDNERAFDAWVTACTLAAVASEEG